MGLADETKAAQAYHVHQCGHYPLGAGKDIFICAVHMRHKHNILVVIGQIPRCIRIVGSHRIFAQGDGRTWKRGLIV
jgi:hypothetical protein